MLEIQRTKPEPRIHKHSSWKRASCFVYLFLATAITGFLFLSFRVESFVQSCHALDSAIVVVVAKLACEHSFLSKTRVREHVICLIFRSMIIVIVCERYNVMIKRIVVASANAANIFIFLRKYYCATLPVCILQSL